MTQGSILKRLVEVYFASAYGNLDFLHKSARREDETVGRVWKL